MARSEIKRGPGAIIFNSATFFSKADIEAMLDVQTSPTPSAVYDDVEEAVLDVDAKVNFTPLGEWEALTTLFPYTGLTLPGTSMFGDTDKPLVVHALDGEKITFVAAALTQMPSIRCTPTETLLTPAEFTCLRSDGVAWTTANSLYAISTAAFASYAAFSKAAVLRVAFAAAWGASPWDTIKTVDGWTIEPELKFDVVPDDALGKADLTYAGVRWMARCTPTRKTMAEITTAMNFQGGTARRGQSLTSADNLVLTGAGGSPVITLNKPGIKRAGFKFGQTTLRDGEIGFLATPTFTSGVKDALITIA